MIAGIDETRLTERSSLLNTLSSPLREEILQLGNRLTEDVVKKYILRVCKERVCSAYEIAVIFGRGRFWARKPLQTLVASGDVVLTIPDKPNGRNQAYYAPSGDKQQMNLDEWG